MTPFGLPAHGLGSRQDLPLPFEFVLLGSALALVASFAILTLAWRRPRWPDAHGRPLPRLTRLVDHPRTRAWLRAAVLALFALVTLALWAGQDRVTNPVFGFVYVWMWVGLVPLSLVLGPVWRVANPLRTVHAALTTTGLPRQGLRPLTAEQRRRVGRYPAALALVAFGWLELVQPDNNTLGVLRAWSVLWTIWVVGGAVLWGERWFAAADPFEAYADLVARLSPWQRISGTVQAVNPLRNLVTARATAGTWALIAALLGSTAFDSFSNTTWWIRTTQDSAIPPAVTGTVGLLAMVGLVALTFATGAGGLRRAATDPRAAVLDPTALSVVPIVVGYALGHYLSLLVIEGQRTAILLSDPLGWGWNLFGTAELGVSTALFDLPAVTATMQLAAIVGGHVLGVLVAHELAIPRLRPEARVTGQLPLLAVMIGYTIGGLLLLFSP